MCTETFLLWPTPWCPQAGHEVSQKHSNLGIGTCGQAWYVEATCQFADLSRWMLRSRGRDLIHAGAQLEPMPSLIWVTQSKTKSKHGWFCGLYPWLPPVSPVAVISIIIVGNDRMINYIEQSIMGWGRGLAPKLFERCWNPTILGVILVKKRIQYWSSFQTQSMQ